MSMKNVLLEMFLFYLAIRTSESWRPFTFHINRFSSQGFTKSLEVNSTVSNNEVTLYMNILEDLPNIYGKAILNFESSSDVYDMEFVNRTIDFCKFLRDKRYEPILQIFHKIFTARGNSAQRCPIKKKLYFMKNTALDAESFPPVMPNKKAVFDFYLYVKYGKDIKTLCRMNVNFEFKNLKI